MTSAACSAIVPGPMSASSAAALDYSQRRRWTVVGLVIAFFAMPVVLGLFSATRIPWTIQNVVLRELTLFAAAAGVAFIIRRKERLGWDSVGLQRPAMGKTACGCFSQSLVWDSPWPLLSASSSCSSCQRAVRTPQNTICFQPGFCCSRY